MILEIKPWTENPKNTTEIMASITLVGGTEMRLQLDVAKEECLFKYKNCNNAPTHSQISTKGIPQHAVYPALPSWEQGGALQQQREEATLTSVQEEKGFTGSVQW